MYIEKAYSLIVFRINMNDRIDIYGPARLRDVTTIKHYDFSEIDGICIRIWDHQYVGIRFGMNEVEDRETIAHELAYLEDGTENTVHITAEKWKWELLIPYEELCNVLKN